MKCRGSSEVHELSFAPPLPLRCMTMPNFDVVLIDAPVRVNNFHHVNPAAAELHNLHHQH